MPSPTVIPVFSRHRHPRLRYVLKELSRDLGYDLRLMTDPDRWKKAGSGAKVSISVDFEDETYLRLPAHPILHGGAPETNDLRVSTKDGVPAFFLVDGIPDYLACCFYALSRYEEYQPFAADAHNRFPAAESHARTNGYLHRPVVREWAAVLDHKLRTVFPELPPTKVHPWRFRPSYDIDILWAWQHRGVRGAAAGFRDLLTGHPARAWKRFTSSPERDPYQSLAILHALHLPPGPDEAALNPIWFWLLADNTDRRDPNPYPLPAAQQALIRELSSTNDVGIHPSYRASDSPEILRTEVERLAKLTGRAVRHSRQHFLRFRLPATYRDLRSAGITHDYTMGYADEAGWRAGTNLPFFWYDLEKEEATGLTVHPFVAMDVTLKNYLGLGPEAAVTYTTNLASAVRPFGGDFMLLWHNSSFAEEYGWQGWQQAYADLVMALRNTGNV
ncbi:hypothetical protein FUA23_00255 [Neolewinella aurantiaca]|uniref:DUF7033 domain-containing protein n=1 Tax=Neolewinella aurantiaca TaxID=2602767 RepID=A0A5C7FK03_9BACT|nr:polysaccharide deacetylase family protein [Neolewinella aurantiaca]TXF91649.1 hypothetical protein FUA23_00255 [Neolewinella aurantiaca]